MARQPKSPALQDAKKFYKLLLYEASGGNLGTKPEHEIVNQTADFGEKKALLAEIIKLAMLEQKSLEDQPEVSGLDLIRRGLANGNRASGSRGNNGGTGSEGGFDNDSEPDSASADS